MRSRPIHYPVTGCVVVTLIVASVAVLPSLVSALRTKLLHRSFDRAVTSIEAGTDTTMTFYGRVVDQDGLPVAGARLRGSVTAVNEQNGSTPGARSVERRVEALSDASGWVEIEMHGSVFRIADILSSDHAWVRSGDSGFGDLTPGEAINHGYSLTKLGGALLHQTSENNPAVFVLLKHGAPPVVHVMMSRGGADVVGEKTSRDGAGVDRTWYTNKPFWPKTTIPKGVVYEPPSTQAN